MHQVPREGCRTINIPQEIGTHYSQFGIFLLNDPNGTITRNIEHKHREHAAKINIEILQEWATGRGKHPMNWNTLTEVLRDIERVPLLLRLRRFLLDYQCSSKSFNDQASLSCWLFMLCHYIVIFANRFRLGTILLCTN